MLKVEHSPGPWNLKSRNYQKLKKHAFRCSLDKWKRLEISNLQKTTCSKNYKTKQLQLQNAIIITLIQLTRGISLIISHYINSVIHNRVIKTRYSLLGDLTAGITWPVRCAQTHCSTSLIRTNCSLQISPIGRDIFGD